MPKEINLPRGLVMPIRLRSEIDSPMETNLPTSMPMETKTLMDLQNEMDFPPMAMEKKMG